MTHLFVGDIQERLPLATEILKHREHVVFLGDVFDSWRYESHEHVRVMEEILGAVQDGRATLLKGNHEVSYLLSHMRASGWDAATSAAFLPQMSRYQRLAKDFLWFADEKLLVSHAGVTQGWWEAADLKLETLEAQLDEAARDIYSWFYAIGGSRGGMEKWGGPLWCDWIDEFEPVAGIRQIVGHSKCARKTTPHHFQETRPWLEVGVTMRRSENGDFCIDCLSETPTILAWDRGSDYLHPVTLD